MLYYSFSMSRDFSLGGLRFFEKILCISSGSPNCRDLNAPSDEDLGLCNMVLAIREPSSYGSVVARRPPQKKKAKRPTRT